MTEQLKPCPFCEGVNVIHSGYRMYCHACGAEGPDADSADESAAIAAWNRRAQPAQTGAEPVGVVRQFRKMRCADWYDGLPDHEDGGGPYETRTLYTHPPARVPLTDEQIGAAINAWFEYDIVAGQRSFAERMRSAIEAAHGIGGGK